MFRYVVAPLLMLMACNRKQDEPLSSFTTTADCLEVSVDLGMIAMVPDYDRIDVCYAYVSDGSDPTSWSPVSDDGRTIGILLIDAGPFAGVVYMDDPDQCPSGGRVLLLCDYLPVDTGA